MERAIVIMAGSLCCLQTCGGVGWLAAKSRAGHETGWGLCWAEAW